jgi:hypothetical protein
MLTIQQKLTDYFMGFSTQHAPYFAPEKQDRIWVHDALHASLNLGPKYRDEQIIAIYQFVLLNSLHVSRKKGIFTPKEAPVTLDDIKTHILPKIDKFIKSLATQFGFKSNPKNKLNDQEVELYFERARVLSKLINRELRQPLRKNTIKEFLCIPFWKMEQLKAISENMFLADTPLAYKAA